MAFWRKFGRAMKFIAKIASGPAGQAAISIFVKNPQSRIIVGGLGGVVKAVDEATDKPKDLPVVYRPREREKE